MAQPERAEKFRALHSPGSPLLLANAWDVASAVITQDAGVQAVATTSAGVAWSLGNPDGDRLPRAEAVESVRRIVDAVDVPVTADVESGYGTTTAEVAQTARAVIAAGAVGVNIEDGTSDVHAPLRDPEEQADRIRAMRQVADDSGVGLFINARIDTYLKGEGNGSGLEDTLVRAHVYLDAGADGVFVPGLADPFSIQKLTDALDCPVNIMVGPGSPSVAELASWGVARVSLGASLACAAFAVAARGAAELLRSGTYVSVQSPTGYVDLNALLEV